MAPWEIAAGMTKLNRQWLRQARQESLASLTHQNGALVTQHICESCLGDELNIRAARLPAKLPVLDELRADGAHDQLRLADLPDLPDRQR